MNRRDIEKRFKKKVNIAPFTAYKIGGPAKYYFAPENKSELNAAVQWSAENEIPFFLLGAGTNVLIADSGFDGLVIHLLSCCKELRLEDGYRIAVGAGVMLDDLVVFAQNLGIEWIAELSGIPGSVGGAVHMNAGAFGVEIGDVAESVSLISLEGREMTVSAEKAGFGYRKASEISNEIITGCVLALKKGDKQKLSAMREEILERRDKKQPLEYPSCGSVFKRPPGDYAGRLIEAAGLKGKRIGGAAISEKHANFIVNLGEAAAEDIYQLITLVKKRVYEESGILLEPEVKLIGFSE